ncbi:NAD(P)H-dependent oxidoreductase [Falsiroseomonas selenitidurans]|uniref:NAD(P)H-dependent oxidoreductase n=1 Tax=Falsiroseomonas selenitidurans TaxID=2716335 RepID=A0ABX1E4T2_9PROT|nr:NAD(P)H-dependent oxidoreductase [Falsiroseomonas selenitidurans]NKC30777.1 NAD(P)H-dependent oxidoreductase [Falsiroseomonas selenitidurans]
MRVLLIHCHPRPDSFSAALRDAARAALEEAGHEVELRDLYAESFDPALSAEERGRYHAVTDNLLGVEDHVASLRRAEALLLVHPTWWYGMPAMLKGWFDRVWAPGVAFRLGEGAITPLLTNIRRIGVITTYGSPRWLLWYIGHPDRKLVNRGIRRLCARDCRVDWYTLTRMDHRSRPECEAFLGRVRAALARW